MAAAQALRITPQGNPKQDQGCWAAGISFSFSTIKTWQLAAAHGLVYSIVRWERMGPLMEASFSRLLAAMILDISDWT
jgi:hypothetical protein